MTWHEIDLGRPIQGPEFVPEKLPRDVIDVGVAVRAVTGSVRLKLTIDDDPTGQVVLDASNTYALWSALGIAIAAVGEARPELTRVTVELPACDSQCYKLPRLPDGIIRHHPDCAVSRSAPSNGGG
jgi:hypothetical protein